VFHLLKPREQWGTELSPHERVMLENIFAGEARTQLSSLKKPLLHCHSSDPGKTSMAALKTKGMYLLDPGSANGYSIARRGRDRTVRRCVATIWAG